MKSLTVDNLRFELRGSDRRKNLQLTVDRKGELVLFVPRGCESSTVAEFVRRKRFWVYRKLAEKERLQPWVPVKQYVNGEGFMYLGRSHRLLLVNSQLVAVKLEEGRFTMLRSAAREGRRHLVRWYSEHGQQWLDKCVGRFAGRVGAFPSRVVVRELGHRWGSCGRGGVLYFHWKTILLPPRIVEYVVVHELVHLKKPRHTSDFWRSVDAAIPDASPRKRWLAENGSIFVSL